MKPSLIFVLILIGCSNPEKEKFPFSHLIGKEAVVLYLKEYKLDSVPPAIGKLKGVRKLVIMNTNRTGWTIYPPISGLSNRSNNPPFKKLPNEISELESLESLALVDLDLIKLPDDFSNLQNLDSLSLFMNKLTISTEIEKLKSLKKLKYLNLTGNAIDTLDIKQLKEANPTLRIDY